MDLDPRNLRQTLARNIVEEFSDIATIVAHSASDSDFKRQFFRGYEFLGSSSSEARRRIFQDPRTVIWVSSMKSDVLTNNGYLTDDRLISSWASRVSILALSAAFLDRETYEVCIFAEPPRIVFLPGTGFSFRYDFERSADMISLDASGKLSSRGKLVELISTPESGGIELVTSDGVISPPDVAGTVPLAAVDIVLDQWLTLLKEATSLIELHSASTELVRCFGSIIVPVQGTAENIHCSVSFSTRPCVLYMSWAPSAKIIAEAIVHESDHQLFYVLTRYQSFWTESVSEQSCIFRSPWREDPRPLDGLLRGAAAFIRVAELWSAVRRFFSRIADDFEWAGQRSVLAARQSLDALSVIRRFGSLTTAGQELVVGLRERADRLLEEMTHEPEFNSWRARAMAVEAEHDEAWRLRHQSIEKDRIAVE